jgi:hypothetical protein
LINSENQKLVKSDFLNQVIEELKNFSINSFYQGDFFLGELLTENTVAEDFRLATKLYYDWEMKKFRLIDLDHYDSRVYKGNQIKLVNLSITVINSPKSPERFDVVIPKTFLSLLNFEDENSKLIFLLKKLLEEWIDRLKDFIFNQLEDRFYSKSIIELIQDGYPIILLNDEFLSSRADGFMKSLPVLNGFSSTEEKRIVRSVILTYVDKTLNLE